MKFVALLFASLVALSTSVFAQSSPGFVPGQVVTPPQLNAAFQKKADFISGLSAGSVVIHSPVALATTIALPANTYSNGAAGIGATLTANANGALVIDGITATAASRVLVANEAAAANNGVYTVTTVGNGSTPYVLTRAVDFNSTATITNSSSFMVTGGIANYGSVYLLQTLSPVVVGTTALNFTEFYGLTIPSCPGSGGALSFTSGVGFGCNTIPGQAADNSALVSTPTASFPSGITRITDGTAGAPPLFFTKETGTCSANGRVNDIGSCVNTTVDGNSWVAQPNGPEDIREWSAPDDGATDAGPFINTACADYNAILVPQTTNGFLIETPVTCNNVSLRGTLSSAINPYPATGFPGQSWFNCNTGASTVCLTLGSTIGSATAPINAADFIVSQATTPAPSGFVGLEVLNSYRTNVRNVHVYNADTCLLAKGNGSVGVDLTFDDVGVDRCQTHWWVFDQINGVHVRGGDDGTDATPSGGPEYTGSVDVYEFTNSAGGSSYQGPNTISIIDHHYINSAGGAACLFNWANFNPTTPNFQTAGGEIKIIGDHFEQHGFIGSDRAAFCSDSSISLINIVNISDDTFTMGSPSFGLFALNSATALKGWYITSNNLGGCGNVTLAPTPASGAALMDVNFTNNVGCSSASFTSNGVGSNYLYSTADDWAALTVGGAWARLSSISDTYSSDNDTASGNVDWINAFPLTWTPVLECGGVTCSSLGWTVTPTSTIVRRDGSGFYASAIETVSVKGTATGAALTVTGLPWECLLNYGQPSPLMGLTNPTSGNIPSAQAQIGAPISGVTPIYLYKTTSTGITGIVDNDFTSTTSFSFDVYCSRTE